MDVAKQPLNPPQHQNVQPGLEEDMVPQPEYIDADYRGSERLKDKVALITGGDSGIGRAVAVHFAAEGADVVIVYLNEHEDAAKTKHLVEAYGRRCLLIAGDVGDEQCCVQAVHDTLLQFGHLDILINNAAQHYPQSSIVDISQQQLEHTFKTNIFSMFYMVKAALPHLPKNSHIINTASVTAYRGSPELLDYSATKGAVVSFTRSLSKQLVDKDIYVNAVAPGPVWTPLIPASFDEKKVSEFGSQVPLNRPAQPSEIAPAFVFLAGRASSYMTGQVIHPNGGEIING
ncbi:SDR family oxidoreductase [Methylophilus medardicus]|uniref:SDR family oxidoreductase n=1 Tax=Methylophilus medardicus TaxID=2588534 RepID=A0A5B8CRC9_9PROT|nr:SDR family oxidoreductase [Methylophilus medardicus]QDC43596.1 SDR family oxidoreductase [Methylophilus medardicus]QDC48603.1 SDR family oxidoreductase [Methylophilus medardicus]QDC52308.1 SDR family oxidoreductase [Methylophilus medardicus]